jgi:hypothetical protein
MPGRLIVVAGSADPKRIDYDPPVDTNGAVAAAEQIGAELARAGCRIIVYTNEPVFIDVHVVRGFVSAKPDTKKSILVRFPAGSAAANFPEYETAPDLFEFQADPHPDWEASFYRSLREAEGVVLIGGGQAALITGHLALGYRTPVMALSKFGGSARRVWQAIVPGQDLPSKDDHALMAQPQWSIAAANAVVRALLAQCERRSEGLEAERRQERDRAHETSVRSLMAGALLLTTIAMLAIGLGWSGMQPLWFHLLLFLSGASAGAAGSTTRALWTGAAEVSAARTTVLGLTAGAISAVLYIAPQIVAAADPPRPLLLFAVVIGFIAGFTFDAVYRKLAETDVVQTDAVVTRKPQV